MRSKGSLDKPGINKSALIPFQRIAGDKKLSSPVRGRAAMVLLLFRLECI